MSLVNLKINKKTQGQLDDLTKKRKAELSVIKFKQDIVADLVDKAHKKECK